MKKTEDYMEKRMFWTFIRKWEIAFWSVFLGIIFLSFGLTFGIVFLVGDLQEDLEMISSHDFVMLSIMLYFYCIPFAIFYWHYSGIKAKCRVVFQRMSREERDRLYKKMMLRRQNMPISRIIQAGNYFCYYGFLPHLNCFDDIVWMYYSNLTFNPSNYERGFIAPDVNIRTLIIRTTDGTKYRIPSVLYAELSDKCKYALRGYGREQKRAVKERVLELEMRDPEFYHMQRRSRVRNLIGGILLVLILIGAGFLYLFMKKEHYIM